MSLNDWQTIYESLRNDIASYAQQSHLRPESKEIILNSINVRLNVSWTELDHDLYQRLVPNLNMNQVYAFVMCVSIAVNSNVVEFSSSVRQMTKVSLATRNGMPVIINVNESEVRAEAMCALSEAKSVLSEAENVLPPMRKCRVLLPKLKSMNGMPVTQKLSMSSTPLTGNASTIMAPMGNDLSVISSELDPHQTNGSCNETQTGKRMSRKRLFDEITETPANKVLRSTRKKRKIRLSPSQHLKSARKVRRKVIDKSMKKVQTVKKERKVRAKQKVNKKIVEIDPDPEPEPEAEPEPEPEPETIQESIVDSDLVLVHDLDKKSPKPHQEKERSLAESPIELNLETMNIEDILATFESSRDILTGLFNNYLKQTDEVVRPADDYKPLDVMSTITHDQFGAMADVLYENFIPVGDINVRIAITFYIVVLNCNDNN